ncbi:DsbA family protein [Streptomyces mirabilis]|uniref:DsbA family oxidoreductase n=1 Tax=Streptomyces mirabilis TaxID=68239 RepID=UPI00225916A4|nr:DsbA family oxidoreductase [Streptomyces mirabilis]MCX4428524.1 DsbA family oxidoreductase [Streptomyces mirabilis]
MQVEIWSDIVCPWCYIGKRKLEAAVESLDGGPAIEVRHRSFELDPRGPEKGKYSVPEWMQLSLGMSPTRVEETLSYIARAAAEVGLTYRMTESRAANTFDAHRLLHLADERGLGTELRERVMNAFVATTQDIADHDTLCRLAAEAGLDDAEAREVLESGAYGDAVRQDESDALGTGVRGVPAFRINGGAAFSGVLSVPDLTAVLQRELARTSAS